MPPEIEVIGAITDIEIIAASGSIRAIVRLRRLYGQGRWRKLKGIALVRFPDGAVVTAELHWYEAHGLGRKDLKVKHILSD